MYLIVPFVFLFTIFAVVNAYFPLLLEGAGFSIVQIGFLLSAFEASGVFVPLILNSLVERKKKYVKFLLLYAVLMALTVFPIANASSKKGGFALCLVAMVIFAVGFRGSNPILDALASFEAESGRTSYGKLRVSGSISFVAMSLVIQALLFGSGKAHFKEVLVTGLPVVLYMASIAAVYVRQLRIDGARRMDMERREDIETHSGSARREDIGGRSDITTRSQSGTPRDNEMSSDITTRSKSATPRGIGKGGSNGFSGEFWLMILFMFTAYMGISPVNRFFSLFVANALKIDAAPALWGISAAAEIPFMFFSGYFIRKFGSRRVLMFCTLCMSVRLLIYVLVPNFTGAVIGQCFHAFTFGLFYPVCIAVITEITPQQKHVTALSIFCLLASGFSNIAGSFIGGLVIDRAGYFALFSFAALIPVADVLVYCVVHAFRKNREISKFIQ